MKGEYVRNTSNYQVPMFGDHFRERTAAWYLKGVRRMSKGWRLGGEIHHMPSDYVNSLPMWSHSARKVLAYHMVEDNDDRDEWPGRVRTLGSPSPHVHHQQEEQRRRGRPSVPR